MIKISCFKVGVISFGSLVLSQGVIAQKEQKPNLLFIITDQQRFDALSIAGNSVLKTPNLDRLARQGAWFRNAYTQCAVSAPARASILTGCTVENHQILTNELAFSVAGEQCMLMPTFDELLSQNGYRCEYYGKWHSPIHASTVYKNPDLVAKNGKSVFGSAGGMVYIYWDYLDPLVPKRALQGGELNDPFIQRPYIPNPLDKCYGMTQSEVDQSGISYSQPDLNGESTVPVENSLTAFQAMQTIDAIERNKDKTFSITCSFHFPHAPMIPTNAYYGMYPVENMPVPASIFDPMTNSPYLTQNGRLQNPQYANPEMIKYMESDYYGLIKEIDDWIGKILDKLDELGLSDNTMVIFTSDHGEMLGSHGMREKNVFYEESAHIPLLIRFPGRIKPETTVNGYVSNINLFATINDYLKMPEYPSDGKSLRGLIEGTDQKMGKYVVTEWLYNEDKQPAYMILKDNWKLFIPYSAESKVINALYNLSDDPYEVNNLLGSNPDRKEYEGKANELRDSLLVWLKDHKSSHYDGVKARNLMGTSVSLSSIGTPKNQLLIFPNPTSGKITVNSNNLKIEGINVYDMFGQIVYKYSESFIGQKTIELPRVNGIYLIEPISEYPFEVQKIMIIN